MNKKMILEHKLMELQKETEDRSVEEMMISETKRLVLLSSRLLT